MLLPFLFFIFLFSCKNHEILSERERRNKLSAGSRDFNAHSRTRTERNHFLPFASREKPVVSGLIRQSGAIKIQINFLFPALLNETSVDEDKVGRR